MSLLHQGEDDIVLVGKNRYFLLLLSYGGLLLLLLYGLWAWRFASSDQAIIWMSLIAVVYVWVIYQRIFRDRRAPSYLKDEIRFQATGIWTKAGLAGQTTGDIEFSWPLLIYQEKECWRFYEATKDQPLLEFKLADRVDSRVFAQSLAKVMQVHLQVLVKTNYGSKFRLTKSETATGRFTRNPAYVEEVYHTPNQLCQFKVCQDGALEYSLQGEAYLVSPPDLRISANGKVFTTYKQRYGEPEQHVSVGGKSEVGLLLEASLLKHWYLKGYLTYANGYVTVYHFRAPKTKDPMRSLVDALEDAEMINATIRKRLTLPANGEAVKLINWMELKA